MAAASTTSRVYIQVMEDVMNKVRDEFAINNNDGGPCEEVLKELQATWEAKMMEAGAILRPDLDLNIPYEEYKTPIIQTPLPVTNIPTGPSDYYSTTMVKGGRRPGPPYKQPFSPWMDQRPPLVVNNDAYVEIDNRRTFNQPLSCDLFFTSSSGKRKRCDDSVDECQSSYKGKSAAGLVRSGSRIPQLDGPIPFEEEEDDGDEPPLNEDDDEEEELDDVDEDEDLNTQNLVLAQFDKVSRTKSRWKCTLKNGIIRMNKKDILFNKATGEFDF